MFQHPPPAAPWEAWHRVRHGRVPGTGDSRVPLTSLAVTSGTLFATTRESSAAIDRAYETVLVSVHCGFSAHVTRERILHSCGAAKSNTLQTRGDRISTSDQSRLPVSIAWVDCPRRVSRDPAGKVDTAEVPWNGSPAMRKALGCPVDTIWTWRVLALPAEPRIVRAVATRAWGRGGGIRKFLSPLLPERRAHPPALRRRALRAHGRGRLDRTKLPPSRACPLPSRG